MKSRIYVILATSLVFAVSTAVNVQSAELLVMGSTNTTGGSGDTIEELSNPSHPWVAAFYGYTADDIAGYGVGINTNDNTNVSILTTTFSYFLDTPVNTSDIIEDRDQNTAGTGLEVTYDTSNRPGTWATTNSLDISLYSVVGTGYAQYFVNPAAAAGSWVTQHLEVGKTANIPEISNITESFTEPIDPPPPGHLPESATMLLFGASLIGLAEVRRLMLK